MGFRMDPPKYYGVGTIIGKGNKERDFMVAPPAMLAVRNYLRQCRSGDTLEPYSCRRVRPGSAAAP